MVLNLILLSFVVVSFPVQSLLEDSERSFESLQHFLLLVSKILFSFQNHFIIKMSILLNPVFILTTALMTFVVQVMRNYWFDVPLLTDGTSTKIEMDTIISRNLNILQSHPRCGLTSGGREECWWGCERHPVNGYKVIFIHN